jgi:hypothetical protein
MAVHDFETLMVHVGHKIAVVTYGSTFCAVHNVAVECETCHEVIMDFDNPALEDKFKFRQHGDTHGQHTGSQGDKKPHR